MRFEHPFWALLFLLFPLGVGLVALFRYWQRRQWEKFADWELRPRLLPASSPLLRNLKLIFQALALAMIVLALMGPQWGQREEEVKMRGINVMLLVDVSHSMLAGDLQPNRLAVEKRKVRDLIKILKGDRVGLVAFAGRSFLLSPLTIDYGTLNRYVDELGPETIPVPGTDLAGALQLALKSFPEGNEGRAILIFTDGEDHSEKMKAMLGKLEEEKIPVFVLGIGTPKGAPVPEPNGGFKKDSSGATVISRLGEDFLKDMALETDGAYVRAIGSDDDLKELYLKGIRQAINPDELSVSHRKIWENRFYWPLGVALALLTVERLIPGARRRRVLP